MSATTIDRPALEVDTSDEAGALLPLLESVCKSQRQLLSIKLGELGVAVGQDRFLFSFEDDKPVAVSDVADRLSVRSSTVSKMADRLEERGWVARSFEGEDKRRVYLHLTRDGIKLREAVRAAETEVDAELTKALGRKAQIIAALVELDDLLTKKLRRLR